jgi:Na+/H+ antiporter NhaB
MNDNEVFYYFMTHIAGVYLIQSLGFMIFTHLLARILFDSFTSLTV